MMNKKFLLVLTSLLLSGCPSINTNSASSSKENLSTSNNESASNTIKNDSSYNELYEDPYIGVSSYDFYANYKEANSYLDAMYRTQHGFISGSIEYTSHIPLKNTIYDGDDFIKFNNYSYGYNENNEIISYNINTKDGTYKTIYKGAGYVALEEVAAYILAFGEVPPNNNYHKTNGRNESIEKWGKYGRVNVGEYRNDISKYPTEPELPTKDSTGRLYQYIETDFGLNEYNDGYSITRGTYRIVFTGEYSNGGKVTDIKERHVFYTYNHYEDFQEYLNYYGGWGDRFGYETSDYTTPTPYIEALIVDKNAL